MKNPPPPPFDCAMIIVKSKYYFFFANRYCENIGRCHKSNNVLWIVNLKNKMIYQKCHDPDCFGFKSQPKQLPEEIYFQIDEEGDTFLSSVITEDIV